MGIRPPRLEEAAREPDVFAGTLTDEDIKREVKRGRLFTDGYDPACVKQACYELRASNIYYLPTQSRRKVVLGEGEYILLKPHGLVVIITEESLNLPDDVIGRILTKGSLFSLGINAVNTYADPGFRGRLGIVFQNQSYQYLKIRVGQPVAKIEFSRLHAGVREAYHGQHGFETEMWPVKEDCILTEQEIRTDPRIGRGLDEIDTIYGEKLGGLLRRVFVLERRLLLTGVLYFLFNFLLLGIILFLMKPDASFWSVLVSVLVGLGSNILFALCSGVLSNKPGGRVRRGGEADGAR